VCALEMAEPIREQETGQTKGFLGGVPLNTETAAVKPRVGSEDCQEVSGSTPNSDHLAWAPQFI